MKYLFLGALLCSSVSIADQNTPLHIGGSALLVTGIYFSTSAFTGRDPSSRLPCLIASTVFSYGYTLGVEIMDANGGYLDGHDMAVNGITILTTATIIYFLDIHGVKAEATPKGIAFRF